MQVYLDQWDGAPIQVSSYIRTAYDQEIRVIETHKIANQKWMEIQFVLPDTKGDLIDEVGLIFTSEGDAKHRALGRLFMDDFRIDGAGSYSIDLAKQSVEFLSVTPFAHQHGEWTLDQDELVVRSEEEAASFTGNYFMRNSEISVKIQPVSGTSHMTILRAQGAKRGYYLGFSAKDEVGIYRNDFGFEELISKPYQWEAGKSYNVAARIRGENITLEIDGEEVLQVQDDRFAYGMVGIGSMSPCETRYKDIAISFEI